MATRVEVEETLRRLMDRLDRLDPAYRPLLPSSRVVEAEFPDINAVYHTEWRAGTLSELVEGPAGEPHIRAVVDSDDLIALATGELKFRRAYAKNVIRIEASMSDLLRLRSVM